MNRDAAAGFTLLEVLAALVVSGLILAALSGGMRFGELALQAQARDIAVENEVGPVDRTLRLLIAQAVPGAAETEAKFRGTARTLSFRTVMPEGLAAVRTREADVSIGVNASHRLFLTWLPWYRNRIIPVPPPQRVDLLSNVDHIEFAYWDPSLNLPPGGWVTAWVGTSVPKLLRVRLIFIKGAGMRWPEIIAATARDRWIF